MKAADYSKMNKACVEKIERVAAATALMSSCHNLAAVVEKAARPAGCRPAVVIGVPVMLKDERRLLFVASVCAYDDEWRRCKVVDMSGVGWAWVEASSANDPYANPGNEYCTILGVACAYPNTRGRIGHVSLAFSDITCMWAPPGVMAREVASTLSRDMGKIMCVAAGACIEGAMYDIGDARAALEAILYYWPGGQLCGIAGGHTTSRCTPETITGEIMAKAYAEAGHVHPFVDLNKAARRAATGSIYERSSADVGKYIPIMVEELQRRFTQGPEPPSFDNVHRHTTAWKIITSSTSSDGTAL